MTFGSLFKNEVIRYRSIFMHVLCINVMCDMAKWAEDRSLPFVVTETVTSLEEDQILNRVSSSHREGRAFDASTRGWPEEKILQFMAHFSEKYKGIAAVAGKSGSPTLIVRHDTGHGDHFHVQINASFKIQNIKLEA